MANPQNEELLKYKEYFKQEAEELLLKGFPTTILQLNTLIANPKFKKRNFRDIKKECSSSTANIHNDLESSKDSEVFSRKRLRLDGRALKMLHKCGDSDCRDLTICPRKKPKLDNPVRIKISSNILETNELVTDLIEHVKPYMIKLVEDAKTMKMWLSYMIPKIEGGDNFGVEIQEETLVLVHAVETCAAMFYDRISKYFITRAKLMKNTIKYPDVVDYKKAVEELDEKEYVSFCLVMCDIRNHYCSLHDVFSKNLDKLKTPRCNQPLESMY